MEYSQVDTIALYGCPPSATRAASRKDRIDQAFATSVTDLQNIDPIKPDASMDISKLLNASQLYQEAVFVPDEDLHHYVWMQVSPFGALLDSLFQQEKLKPESERAVSANQSSGCLMRSSFSRVECLSLFVCLFSFLFSFALCGHIDTHALMH